MPNTKSAERRARNSARKQSQNIAVKSRLHTLEKSYETALATGKKEDAGAALRNLASALDKAAKTGVVHKSRASRKKSRLTVRFNAVGVVAPAVAAPSAAAPAAK
jgi:small subunit ribosomal protein S20